MVIELLVAFLGPVCGVLLSSVASEELPAAKKFIVPLLWILGVTAAILTIAAFLYPSFFPVLVVVLFLAGICGGILFSASRRKS